MAYEELLYEVRDSIATVTLNRPDKLNAWTFTMGREYLHAMADAEARDDVRVIVVTGAGRGFCAGADLGLLAGIIKGEGSPPSLNFAESDAKPGQGNEVRQDLRTTVTFPMAIAKPVIAAVNGAAVGLGLVQTLYCDLRFASETARFGTAFVQRGLIAEYGMAWMLPRLVGVENALDMLFSGRVIDAQEALRMGLVNRVIPADKFMPTVREYAALLATQSSPRSMGVMKRQVYEAMFTDLSQALDFGMSEMLKSFCSQDFREGVMSFMEKRPPRFTGG